MRAAYYETNGSAREVLRVGEVETPQAGPGEVRVKLATSGVNPSDVKSRQGATRKIAWPRVIPHSDGAGVIDQVGDGVPNRASASGCGCGTASGSAPSAPPPNISRCRAAQAVKLPDAVSFEAGACLGIPAMTASHAVTLSHAVKGTTLLIAGGAGAVSQYAIQFAKARGARVIATVSSADKAKVALEAGADHTIDYKRENVGERVMAITDKHGVDAVIEMDLAANAKLLPGVLRPKGSVIVYGTGAAEATLPAFFCLTQSIRVQFFLVYELDHAMRERELTAINSALAHGTLQHRVAQPTFALADIVAAHEAVEQGTIGNVIVTM